MGLQYAKVTENVPQHPRKINKSTMKVMKWLCGHKKDGTITKDGTVENDGITFP